MKGWVVRQRAGTFDFGEGEVVRFVQAHGVKVRGHCRVWDHTNPDWLVHGAFSPSQMSGSLQQHVTTVMKHYAGQVFAWDVVNEALGSQLTNLNLRMARCLRRSPPKRNRPR
jgi:endo-1,4-beta-xylanase